MTILNIAVDLDATDHDTISIWRAPNGDIVIRKESQTPMAELPAGTEELADDATLAEIFDRWADENASSGAFELVRQLRKRGIGIVAPQNRKTDKKVEPYVRLLAKSASGVTIAAYINTRSMNVSRQNLRKVAAASPGADIHANGNVYFDVDDVTSCMKAVDALLQI